MKLMRKRGDVSNIWQIFIQDSSSATGAGLAGLVFNSGSLTAYFHRDIDTTATAITLVTMTVGTFTSGGFKEIDATNMPGWYQFCPPDAALAGSGTPKSVGVHLKGATNMAPLAIEVQLDALDREDGVRMGLTALPNVASGSAGAIPTTGTGANQISVTSGVALANATQINADATSAANLASTTRAIARGTVGSASTTTSIITSACTPSGAVANQFVGRTVLFDGATTTTALRGQAASITASSNAAAPVFTVSALTTAPASGDLFSVI